MPPLYRKKPGSAVNLNASKQLGTVKKPKSVFKTRVVSKFKLENFVKVNHTNLDLLENDHLMKDSTNIVTSTTDLFNNNQSIDELDNIEDSIIDTINYLSPDLFESSGSSQISYNDPVVKGAYLHFLETRSGIDIPPCNDNLTQLSSCSMNDPEIKGKFLHFLDKEKVKKNKPHKKSKKGDQDSGIAEKENLSVCDNSIKESGGCKQKKNEEDRNVVNDSVINNKIKTNKNKMKKVNKDNQDSQKTLTHIREKTDEILKQKVIHTEPKFHSHKEKMEWLLETRNVGLYVLCDRCNKTRYLKNVSDPLELPEKWYCENHPDAVQNSCHFPQLKIPDFIEQQLIENLYNSGSIVWAHLEGFPWWPAMVDNCPETEEYFWLDDLDDTKPTWYHVTYFDTAGVTRNWLKVKDILPFKAYVNPNKLHGIVVPRNLSRRLDKSVRMATEALKMPLMDRLRRYSFIYRYKKPINPPKQDQSEAEKPKRNLRKKRREKPDKMKKIQSLKGQEDRQAVNPLKAKI